jgi:putative ABC transport system substrate-binding protein
MDVIVTHGSIGGRAAQKATATIPIVVATASDFVGAGLVAGHARPGGNVTGTNDQAADITVKQIELLADAVPGLQRVAILWNGSNPVTTKLVETLQAAGRQPSLTVIPLAMTRPEDVEKAIEAARRERAQGVIVAQESWTLTHRARIAELGPAKRLPIVSASGLFPQAGALASDGPDLPTVYRHAAVFVDKILKGVKPGDIPVEQPTNFELVINLRTAKALGLTIPPSLLGRADHVIE